jgi:hypothetical protein
MKLYPPPGGALSARKPGSNELSGGVMEAERAGRYSDLFGTGADHEHPSNCAYCPICTTVGVLRNAKPEVIEHLAAAAREMLAAARLLIEEVEKVSGAPESAAAGRRDDSPVRRIDGQ